MSRGADPPALVAVTSLYPDPHRPHRAAFNRQEFAALARLGCRVGVAAPIAWTDRLRAAFAGRGRTPAAIDAGGVAVRRPTAWHVPGAWRGSQGPLYAASIARTFRALVEEVRPDLVYGSWAYPDGWAAARLARRAGLPAAIKVHGSDLRALDRHPSKKARTAEALRAADLVLCVSADLAERARALGANPDRVAVLYYGVDRGLFRPGPSDAARARLGLDLPADEPLVVAVGNLLPVKGHDVLIEALAHLNAAGRRCRAAIVGPGPRRSALAALATARGVGDRVTLLGGRPLEEVADWHRAADVCALPSRSEGVPNALLEAMACGRPAVASGVGGVPEVAGLGSVRLVPPGDVAALADALAFALDGGLDAGLPDPPRVPDMDAQMAEQVELFRRIVRR